MADVNIGSLPTLGQVNDDSLLVAEQQGAAGKITGLQLKQFAREAASVEANKAAGSANSAAASETSAAQSASDAQAAQKAAEKAKDAAENAADIVLDDAKQQLSGYVESGRKAAQDAENAAQQAAKSANEAKQNVESALQEAKESGEFDGPRGPEGKPGAPPIVGDNGNWHTWDGENYVDTGVPATALHDENSGSLVKMWFGTIQEYNALDTIYSDVLYHVVEGAVPV